ncbi:ketol-acid reductoisomerase [Psychrobacter sp. JCM 18901]|nr:ketol-acid reductoisomerase [Psychrobacter sp. JCM 18901]
MNVYYDKDCDLSIIQGKKKLPLSVTVHKAMHTRLTYKIQTSM